MKRVKITPKKPLKDDALDRMHSLIVRGLFGNRCVVCGETQKRLHAHHWVGRRYKTTRWLIENGVCLCHNCHQELHDMPKFRKDVERRFIGTDKLEQLELKARRGVGIKVDKQEIKEQLQEKLKEVE